MQRLDSRLLYSMLFALLLLAPLFRSGKASLAQALLEFISLALLGLQAYIHGWQKAISSWQAAAIIGLFALPILFIFPMPALLAESLPGRNDASAALLFASSAEGSLLGGVSIIPRETLGSILILLLPVAAFLATMQLRTRQMRALVALVLIMAAGQAVLGLMQFGQGSDSALYLGLDHTHFGSAVGTYTSRNNYVGLMYLALMLSLGLLIANLGNRRSGLPRGALKERLVFLSTARGHQAFWYGALSLLLLLAIVFSRSRGGIGLTMLGLFLVTIALSRRIGGDNVYGFTGTLLAAGVGIGTVIGLAPVLDRFSASDPLSDGRWTIFEGTFVGITKFFPLGSGPGTFTETFHPFQDLSQAGFLINRAHNDYLEWIYDGGIFAAALIVLFLGLYLHRWTQVHRTGTWGEFRYIQVCAGIGMGLMLLHELVDYNLMVPANMVYFAFMAGLFFHDYEDEEDLRKSKAGSGKRLGSDDSGIPAVRTRPKLATVNEDDGKNPFMD